MEKIYSKVEPTKLLHVINRLSDITGRNDIIPEDNFIQCATLKMEKDKTETLLGMAQSRVTASNAARQAARDQIMGGIGSMGSAMVGIAGTDYFKDHMAAGGTFFKNPPK